MSSCLQALFGQLRWLPSERETCVNQGGCAQTTYLWIHIQPVFRLRKFLATRTSSVFRSVLHCFANSFKCDSLKNFSDLGLHAWMPFSSPASTLQHLCSSSPTIRSTQGKSNSLFNVSELFNSVREPAAASSTKSFIFLCLRLVLAPGSVGVAQGFGSLIQLCGKCICAFAPKCVTHCLFADQSFCQV